MTKRSEETKMLRKCIRKPPLTIRGHKKIGLNILVEAQFHPTFYILILKLIQLFFIMLISRKDVYDTQYRGTITMFL